MSGSARTERRRRAAGLAVALAGAALAACLPKGAHFDPIDIVAPSFTEEDEREIGFAFDQELQQQVRIVDDPLIASFVNDLGRRILAQAGPQPFLYRFRLIPDRSLNAFAVPGGYVYLHTGTLEAAGSLDELAGVVGHEIAHVKLRHHAKLRERAQLPDLVAGLAGLAAAAATGEPGALLVAQGVNVALQLRFSREFEAEADQEGTRLMAAAGYDPRGLRRFFERLLDKQRSDPDHLPPYLYSHPDVERRVRAVDVYAESLSPAPRPDGELDARLRAVQARLAMLDAGGAGRRLAPAADGTPADPRKHFEAGEAAMAAGDAAGAIVQFRRTTLLDPTRALVFLRLGEAYEQQDDRQRAVFAYEQALRRAGPAGSLHQRAERAVERLTFTVVEEAELDRDAEGLAWRARLGPRFRDHTARMRVRWRGPDGRTRGETPVRKAGRGEAESLLELADGEVSGRWTAEALLDDHVVDRRSEKIGA